MLNVRIDSYIDGLEGLCMDFAAMSFLLLFVVLIGGILIFIVTSGIAILSNSTASLIETLDDFIHRNDRAPAPPKTPKKPARYLP